MTDRLDLVTGATGFSASHVIAELLAAGHRVVATDRAEALRDRRDRLGWAGIDPADPHLELVAADLLDPGSLDALFTRPITHIFHTASLYDYSASLERLMRINVDGTKNLVARAVPAGIARFVHWSTCGVFGKPYTAADGPRCNVPFDEARSSPKNAPSDATDPAGTKLVNDYARSKWVQEQLVWEASRRRGLPVTIIRPAPIYGPGGDYGHGGIILAVARGYVPFIPADARNAITTSVHVRDLARFATFVAERDDTIGEDYNVVDDSIISYHEFLHYIALLCGRRLVDVPLLPLSVVRRIAVPLARTWTFLERRLDVPRLRVLEVQSAAYIGSSYWLANGKSKRIGFEYRCPDVRAGLRETVAWFRDAGWI